MNKYINGNHEKPLPISLPLFQFVKLYTRAKNERQPYAGVLKSTLIHSEVLQRIFWLQIPRKPFNKWDLIQSLI